MYLVQAMLIDISVSISDNSGSNSQNDFQKMQNEKKNGKQLNAEKRHHQKRGLNEPTAGIKKTKTRQA